MTIISVSCVILMIIVATNCTIWLPFVNIFHPCVSHNSLLSYFFPSLDPHVQIKQLIY